MQSYIYRSAKKEGLYIYLAEQDDFDCLPESLMKQASPLELAMELFLTAEKKLRKEDVRTVVMNLKSQGYHVQLPETVESLINSLPVQE